METKPSHYIPPSRRSIVNKEKVADKDSVPKMDEDPEKMQLSSIAQREEKEETNRDCYRRARENYTDLRRRSEAGNRKQKRGEGIHYYGRRIASLLNPKQPDVTAAVVLYNLWLWQGNSYKQTLIDRRRYSFRSLSQLASDHPYFTKAAIYKAIRRLEKRLGEDFKVNRDKDELWFSIHERTGLLMDQTFRGKTKAIDPHLGRILVNIYKNGENPNKLNRFYVEDATRTGSVRSAVILANLKYALSVFTDPKRDEFGNAYAELSPRKLSQILHYSEDTISRSIRQLIQHKQIVRHKTALSFYRLPDQHQCQSRAQESVSGSDAEVQGVPAKVNSMHAEVNGKAAEVNCAEIEPAVKPRSCKASRSTAPLTCSNIVSNQCSNECFKGSNLTSPSASPPARQRFSSKGLQVLYEMSLAKLAEIRANRPKKAKKVTVKPSDLPYDYIAGGEDLPYDYTPNETHQQSVDRNVREMIATFQYCDCTLDKEDLRNLRELFDHNAHLSAEDLAAIFYPAEQRSVKLLDPGKRKKRRKFTDYWEKAPLEIRLINKVKTPKAFLRYLPQIIRFRFGHVDFENQVFGEDYTPEPYDSINFDYLKKAPKSKIAESILTKIEKIYTSFDSNPIQQLVSNSRLSVLVVEH